MCTNHLVRQPLAYFYIKWCFDGLTFQPDTQYSFDQFLPFFLTFALIPPTLPIFFTLLAGRLTVTFTLLPDLLAYLTVGVTLDTFLLMNAVLLASALIGLTATLPKMTAVAMAITLIPLTIFFVFSFITNPPVLILMLYAGAFLLFLIICPPVFLRNPLL